MVVIDGFDARLVVHLNCVHDADDWNQMTEVGQELAEMKTKIDAANMEQARMQARFETAQEALESARTELKEKYGVSTIDEAKEKLAEIKCNLDAELSKVRSALAEFDAISNGG